VETTTTDLEASKKQGLKRGQGSTHAIPCLLPQLSVHRAVHRKSKSANKESEESGAETSLRCSYNVVAVPVQPLELPVGLAALF